MMEQKKENDRVYHNGYGGGTIIKVSPMQTTVMFDDGRPMTFSPNRMMDPELWADVRHGGKGLTIQHISVKGLFGRLDYELTTPQGAPVSILTAPNGCGKTTIFKLIHFLFMPQRSTYAPIADIPFTAFRCTLSNGMELSLIKEKTPPEEEELEQAYETAHSLLHDCYNLIFALREAPDKEADVVSFAIIAQDWRRRGSYLRDEAEPDPILRPGMAQQEQRFNSCHRAFCFQMNEKIQKYRCGLWVDFIDANRLSKDAVPVSRDDGTSRVIRVDWLDYARRDLSRRIQSWLQSYNQRLDEARNKLPNLYLSADDSTGCDEGDFDIFQGRWERYHSELHKYQKIGLLASSEIMLEPGELKAAYQKKGVFLSTYLKAFEPTLQPLREHYDKLELLADIFNKRNEVTGKTISFTPEGIKLFAYGEEIDMDHLSSGEKNDFVMFYRLIFNTDSCALVLVDEPEISLHIEWQEEYLNWLLKICEVNRLQAIVATHSPNIVNDHFDLFMDKG